MPRILLIGDSIRIGYQPVVARRLAPQHTVLGPDENAAHSNHTLQNLEDWLDQHPADIVHYNNGLHDLARDPNPDKSTGTPRVPAVQYAENVRTILSRLRQRNLDVIVALTTPVNQQQHHDNKGFDRLEADVENYNRILSAVAGEFDLPVNDLFTVVKHAGQDQIMRNDGVHYTEQGSEILGQAVAKYIQQHLTTASP